MHMLKLVLPLAGLLMAGQALAHKASHTITTTPAPARAVLAQAGTRPAELSEGVGGRSARSAPALAASETAEAIGKKHRYTFSH